MKRLALLVLFALLACTSKGPLPVHVASGDAGATAAGAASAPRTSHREELLREATTTGLDVVYEGWLEPQSVLGAAMQDTCLRVRAAASTAAGGPATLVLREGGGDAGPETSSEFSLHDTWTTPHCVRRGTRVTLSAGVPTEVVVVASAAFR